MYSLFYYYREFEQGIVLANPSPHSYTFNMQAVFGKQPFRRLQATTHQDQHANNGNVVGSSLTPGSQEGLFLVKE
jgi:hypothetical protein